MLRRIDKILKSEGLTGERKDSMMRIVLLLLLAVLLGCVPPLAWVKSNDFTLTEKSLEFRKDDYTCTQQTRTGVSRLGTTEIDIGLWFRCMEAHDWVRKR